MAPDPQARLIELCQQLAAATGQGRVEWAAEEDTAFVTTFSAAALAIKSRDRDGDAPYELDISTPEGTKVETLVSEWTEREEPADWNMALYELYRAARRQALGVDRILDALLAELRPDKRAEVEQVSS